MKFQSYRIFALSLGLFAALTASAQGKVLSVTGARAEGGYMLHVTGEDLAKPQIVLINSGTTALITFKAVWSSTTTTVKVGMNGIDFYRIGQFKTNPPQARIAVYFEKGYGVICSPSQAGWDLFITKKDTTNKLADDTAVADAIAMAKAMKELSGTVSPVKKEHSEKAEPNKTENQKPKTTSEGDAKAMAEAVKALSDSESKSSSATQASNPKVEAQAKRLAQTAEADAKAMAQAVQAMSSKVTPVNTTKSATETTIKPLTVEDQKPATAPSTIRPLEPKSPAAASVGTPQSRVNIEFFDTDLTIILKALSEQTGSNIVASPEVKATLTVSLKNITVEHALDLVTKLSGYRYAKLGNTYIVGTSSFLQKILSQETNVASMTTTRVVPLASRKAGEIKRTILKALSIDALNETLRVVHPAERTDLTDLPVTGAAKGEEGAAQKADPGTIEGDADYLILVGDKDRVEQAARMITQIDQALADMLGVAPPNSDGLRPITMTYVVRGGKAADLAEAIKAFQGGVMVTATPKDNRSLQTVVLHGRPAEVERLYNMLAQIDDVAGIGEIVYAVYDVKFADPRALRDRLMTTFERLQVMTGPEGASGLSYTPPTAQGGQATGQAATTVDGGKTTEGVSALNAKAIYTPREFASVPMKLILSGPEETVKAALEFARTIDIALPQIAIEARIVDATKEEILKAGISWDIFTGGAVNSITLDNSQPAGSDGSPFNMANVRLSGRGWGGTVIGTLDRALNKANFISKPNIIAHDGREAVVFVGDIVRYIKAIQVTPTGTNVEVGEEEVGVKLNVLPRVGADGSITLEVQPVVSFIRSFLETGTGGLIPITAVRTARSTMRIANGETIAIGGLITEEIRKEVSGLPILMDLPIIGNLFKRTTNTKRQGEIIIFLSARIIEGDSLAASRGTGQPETTGNGSTNGNGKGG